MKISELELSIRTQDVINEMSVTTLEELLSVPVIHCSKLSALELQELFKELKIKYKGVFKPREFKELITINGTLKNRWKIISKWIRDNDLKEVTGFNPPTTIKQILKVENELGVKLPKDYSSFLLLQNGQDEFGVMLHTCPLIPIEELNDNYYRLQEPYDKTEQLIKTNNDERIKKIEISKKWIPIGVSSSGYSYFILDLDPTKKGVKGQIFLKHIDSNYYTYIASNFKEFLSEFFTGLQRNELV